MARFSRRTQHVLGVVRSIREKTLATIDHDPEGCCSEAALEGIVIRAYPEVAYLHGVRESTVRDACTRSSGIPSSSQFYLLARGAILGDQALSAQLAETCKSNESAADIAAAFQNL